MGRSPRRRAGSSGVKVNVGAPWGEDDLDISISPHDVESRTRARVALIIVIALVVLYTLYFAPEWWTGKSFEGIGRFLENGISLFIGWCVGKAFPRRREELG